MPLADPTKDNSALSWPREAKRGAVAGRASGKLIVAVRAFTEHALRKAP